MQTQPERLKGKSWQNATDLPLSQYRVWIRAVSTTDEVSNWSPPPTFSIVVPTAPMFDPVEVGARLASAPLLRQLDRTCDFPMPPSPPGASCKTEPICEDQFAGEWSFSMTFPDRGSEHNSALSEKMAMKQIGGSRDTHPLTIIWRTTAG